MANTHIVSILLSPHNGFPKPQSPWLSWCPKTSFELNKKANSKNDDLLLYKGGFHMGHPMQMFLNNYTFL
jgi:hypothetical protein